MMLKNIFFFLFITLNAFPQKLSYWQVFNEFQSFEALFTNHLDFYYCWESQHYKKTIGLLIQGKGKEAHTAFKEESKGQWLFKIDTALIAFHFFKDQEILNREIQRLKKLMSTSTMKNQLARLMIFTGRVNEAKDVLLSSLKQAKDSNDVFEIARLSHLIKFKKGIIECYKYVSKNDVFYQKETFTALKYLFAVYGNNQELKDQTLKELIPIDGFYILTSLYDIIPDDKKLEFLLSTNYHALAEYVLHKGGFLNIPPSHIEKMLSKYGTKGRKEIVDGITFKPFELKDKANEESFEKIYIIALLGDKKRAKKAFDKLLKKEETSVKKKFKSLDGTYNNLLYKALIYLELDLKEEAEKTIKKINRPFKYRSDWAQHPLLIKHCLKLIENSAKEDFSLPMLDARITLNQKEETLKYLKESFFTADKDYLPWFAERVVETGNFENLALQVLKKYINLDFSPSFQEIQELGFGNREDEFIDFKENNLSVKKARQLQNIITNVKDPNILKKFQNLSRQTVDILSNPNAPTVVYSDLLTFTARSFFLNKHEFAKNYLLGAEEIADEDDELLNVAETYILFTQNKKKALEVLQKVSKTPNTQDSAKLAECLYKLDENKSAKKVLETALKKDSEDGTIQRVKFLYYDGFVNLKFSEN